MEHENLKRTMEYVAVEMGKAALDHYEELAPFGVSIDMQGENPLAANPGKEVQDIDERLAHIVDILAQRTIAGGVGAIAVVCGLEKFDGSPAMAVQIDTPTESFMLVYPCLQTPDGWDVGEPEEAPETLVGEIWGLDLSDA